MGTPVDETLMIGSWVTPGSSYDGNYGRVGRIGRVHSTLPSRAYPEGSTSYIVEFIGPDGRAADVWYALEQLEVVVAIPEEELLRWTLWQMKW